MEAAVESPLDIKQVSSRVGVSPRQVERLFREQLGTSPKTFYLELRLARARTLLRQTVNPILNIAFECGFGSTSHLYHAYRRVFGIAPTEERRRNARSTKPASRPVGLPVT